MVQSVQTMTQGISGAVYHEPAYIHVYSLAEDWISGRNDKRLNMYVVVGIQDATLSERLQLHPKLTLEKADSCETVGGHS